MTDTDAGDANAEEDDDDEAAKTPAQEGAAALVDTLIENQIVAVLVQNMERLDETVKEEADGVHNSLGKRNWGLQTFCCRDRFHLVLLFLS